MNIVQTLAIQRGWNDLQIAKYLGLPRNTVRNWLNGTRAPGAAAVRLVQVLENLDKHSAVTDRV